MTMNPLPPQAYTRETLAQAYNWLSSQPENIRQMAKTPDILVSLYLKAQMHGEEFFERPSLVNFKNDLKHLAGIMGEFEGSGSATPAPPGFQPKNQPPAAQISGNTNTNSTPQYSLPHQTQAFTHHQHPSSNQTNNVISELSSVLDGRSMAMINEVRHQFNLSSETESVRFLIALGYQKLKSL